MIDAAPGKNKASTATKEDIITLVPDLGTIGKNALISKAQKLPMGVNRARAA